MRSMPMRCTPMRSTTMRNTPMRVMLARQSLCQRPHRQDRLGVRKQTFKLPPTFHIEPSPIPTAIYPKLTMEFEGGAAFDSVSASVLRPAPVGEPASKGGPQAEFDVPGRLNLLTTLKNVLNVDIPPTAWACLWLSDIDKLEELVNGAKQQPVQCYNYFQSIESEAKIVQKWSQRECKRSGSSTPRQLSALQSPPSQIRPSPPQPPPISQSERPLSRKRRQDSVDSRSDSRSRSTADLVCLSWLSFGVLC
jgi:hypothetical protein